MVRLSSFLAAVIWLLEVPPVGAGEPRTGPRPLKPRPGEVFEYQGSLPQIQISWKVPGPVGNYILQIARRSGSSPEVATYVIKKQTSFRFRPAKNGRYRWWVAGMGSTGEPTHPGPARYFVIAPARRKTVTPEPAEAPEPLRPAEGKTFSFGEQRPRVKLGWSKRPVARYQIELARDPGFKQRFKSLLGPRTSSRVEIETAGRIYWRVRGRDPDTGWSKTRSFTVAKIEPVQPDAPNPDPDPPPADEDSPGLDLSCGPELQDPGNQTRIVATKPRKVLLFWESLEGASAYQVELATSEDFSKIIIRRKVARSMMALPSPPRGTVYWRVRALDPDGREGAWSEVWQFSYQEQGIWD